ncbi:MAG: hypothetical protein JXA21_13295 [Anaerolineae bacterium]|nr:hypothetical protein [Anaerolineae bacterium]
MFGKIASADLREDRIPAPDADWGDVGEFALSFDGYAHWGSFDRCAEIGNRGKQNYDDQGELPASLTELRTCLFFEQRRFRHYGVSPEGADLGYIRALVAAIRDKVLAQEFE